MDIAVHISMELFNRKKSKETVVDVFRLQEMGILLYRIKLGEKD